MEATIKEVREFFDIPVSQFAKEWRMLSDKDKADLKKVQTAENIKGLVL